MKKIQNKKTYSASTTIDQWGTWEIDSVPHYSIKDFILEQLEFDENDLCTNAFQVITDPMMLKISYEKIKSKPGNMVEGTDDETLDGIDLQWFLDTSSELRKESFNFRPSRRVHIPKANGKMRPLGISSPRDKIIQQSARMVLELILEPKFSNLSHGFRPKRGCHTALREVRNWKGVAWFIEGDIKSFFDSIDHHILEKLLLEHFKERRLISLYWKFVKAGYIEFDKGNNKTFINSTEGVPQGGILSPLLSNLILNELDKYMEKLIVNNERNNKGIKPYKKNLEYHAISMRIQRLRRKIEKYNDADLRKEYLKTLRMLISKRRRYKSIIPNEKVTSVKYVRYADDWIIGVWGTRKLAVKLKNDIQVLLKNLKLDLSVEKTLITNARAERAVFLGTQIKRLASNKGETKVTKGKRIPTGNLLMTAPILKLVNKAIEKGLLIIKNGRWKPISINKFLPLGDSDIILRYNTIIRGILNYYSFVDNRQKLTKLSFIIKESLRKTLSRKHKLNKKRFLSKFGKKIGVHRTNAISLKYITFYEPKLIKEPMNFLGSKFTGSTYFDPFDSMNWRVSTKTNFDFPCASCGNPITEMHHIKHIKTLGVKLNKFDQAVARVNRKQVPLCRPCHLKVHTGQYVGSPLSHWRPVNQLTVKPNKNK